MQPPRKSPVDHLTELYLALGKSDLQLSIETRMWFVMAVRAVIRDGLSFDEALGFAAAGKRSLQRRLRMGIRDRLLVAALQAVAVEPDVDNWERCKRLALLLDDFAARWPKIQGRPPSSDWPQWKCLAYRAASTGLVLPRTPQGLRDIAKRTPPFSVHDLDSNMLVRYF